MRKISDLFKFDQPTKIDGNKFNKFRDTSAMYEHRRSSSAEDFVSFLAHCQNGSSATVTLQCTEFPDDFSDEKTSTLNEISRYNLDFCVLGPKGRIFYNNGHLKIKEDVSKFSQPVLWPPCDILVELCKSTENNIVKNGVNCDQNEEHILSSVADFSDAKYIRYVIDAILKSRFIGSWTEVEKMV